MVSSQSEYGLLVNGVHPDGEKQAMFNKMLTAQQQKGMVMPVSQEDTGLAQRMGAIDSATQQKKLSSLASIKADMDAERERNSFINRTKAQGNKILTHVREKSLSDLLWNDPVNYWIGTP